MGLVHPPPPAKLICGLLAGDVERLARGIDELSQHLGPIEIQSEAWPFRATEYYAEEMGQELLRQFVCFGGRFEPERLASVKRATNTVEMRLCEAYALASDHRPLNLDPGYVTLGKLVLATTKDHAHRVYLEDGIYAEVTLRYVQQRWQPWPWTYPDYASGAYDPFLLEVRRRLKAELMEQTREERAGPSNPAGARTHD